MSESNESTAQVEETNVETNQNETVVDEVKAEKTSPSPAFEKVLKEKRNAMERVRQLEAEKQELVNERLREKEDFKTLYETSQSELKALKESLETERSEKIDGFKKSALKKELMKMGANPSRIDTLLKLGDMSTLKYDDEHKIVLGVEAVAKSIKDEMPDPFGTTNAKTDDSAPSTEFSTVNKDNYKQMAAKDRKNPEVMKQLFAQHGITLKK